MHTIDGFPEAGFHRVEHDGLGSSCDLVVKRSSAAAYQRQVQRTVKSNAAYERSILFLQNAQGSICKKEGFCVKTKRKRFEMLFVLISLQKPLAEVHLIFKNSNLGHDEEFRPISHRSRDQGVLTMMDLEIDVAD